MPRAAASLQPAVLESTGFSGMKPFLLLAAALPLFGQPLPLEVPHRRSNQLTDGFGMNVDLPRERSGRSYSLVAG